MSSSERPGPVPSSRWQRLRLLQPLDRQSLRYQFTVAILGVLLPAFAISYAVVNHLAVRQITAITKTRLRIQAELISSGLRKWEDSTRTSLTAVSFDRALRERDVAASQALLNSLQTIYPGREWRFWSADPQPRLLAATGQMSEEGRRRAEASILKREYFRQALSGQPSYSVVRSYLNNQSCLMVAQPVYPRLRDEASAVSRPLSSQSQFVQQHLTAGVGGQKPNGVLISCIKLRDIAIDTGLKTALADSQLDPAAASSDLFDSKKPFTSAFLLVSRQGHVLYPTVENYNGRIPMVTDFIKGPWAPLMGLAQRAQRGDESFGRVQIHANRYFVLTNRADTAWSTMLIVNETEIFSALNHLMRSLVIFGVISVLLAAGAIYWQCGRLISPIRQAGRALDRISTGDFDVRIPPQRSDEIGTLLANINQTAQKLRLFLSHETAHAVTQKQLETAREIQKDFLVEVIPSSPQFELAALSEPAYDVGADWYDALVVDGITYVVVADVCDKGIPSALYMSVFRSLLRYGLLALRADDADAEDPGAQLRAVIRGVNHYMATNHRASMMFATVFLAALDPSHQRLHYVSAGHETPLLMHRDRLEKLPHTGPAVGLFPEARYGSQTVQIEAGDYLIAYTDGIVDARSPQDAPWGLVSLQRFIEQRAGSGLGAQQVLNELLIAVHAHMGETEPFDDMTVMVMHVAE